MAELVSILIPAYNAERWIRETMLSAINQTWPNKEIVVVDDGSRDQTLSIARQFASREVSVVTQANQGAAVARNHAFSICQGDYIQWLDADDLLAPDKIARQVEALDQAAGKRTLLSSAWGQFMYRPHRANFVPTALWCDLSPAEWLLRKMGQNIWMQTATWLVSRELTEAAGPWNTQLLGDDDGEYFCRVLLASNGTRFVPEARVFYRMPGSNNLSYIGRSERKMEALFLSMQLHIGYLRSLEDTERSHQACLRYLKSSYFIYYPEMNILADEARSLARQLGGDLAPPQLSWKYSLIQNLLGWKMAKASMRWAPRVKAAVLGTYDKALYGLEARFNTGSGLDKCRDSWRSRRDCGQ